MLSCILTKNVITSCSVTMMLFLHLEVKPLMTLTTGLYLSCALIFFFQAKVGIRDLTVTGVQTCALPICSRTSPGGIPKLSRTIRYSGCTAPSRVRMMSGGSIHAWRAGGRSAARAAAKSEIRGGSPSRSEKRRGGEGGRIQGLPDH